MSSLLDNLLAKGNGAVYPVVRKLRNGQILPEPAAWGAFALGIRPNRTRRDTIRYWSSAPFGR